MPAPAGRGSSPSTTRALLRLYGYARPALPRLVAGGLASLVASLMALAVPQVLQALVNGPLLGSGGRGGVVTAAAAVLGLGVLEAVLVWSRRALILTPGTRVEAQMRTELFDHLLELPVSYHDRTSGGQLLSRSMSDLHLVRRWMAFGLVMLVVSVTTVVVGVALMFASSWVLGLVYLLGAVPVIVLGVRFRTEYRVIARLARDQSGDLATTVEESVHGIRVLKAFGRGEDALDEFSVQADELRGTELRKAGTQARLTLALGGLPELALGLALGIGVAQVAAGQVSVGGLVAFFATAAVVGGPVERLGQLLAMTLDARTAADRFYEVMDTANTLRDPDSPRSLPPAGRRGAVVDLEAVSFRYPGADTGAPDVVHGVDLRMEPGETLALVGLTGSGKTTIAQLVPRLYDVTAGAVRIDGVDVRDMTRAEVRRAVAVAFEDPLLFSASVRENVLLGVPSSVEGEMRERLLLESIEVAGARFVLGLPEGLDTVIGEEGLSLSGGQRQRIALARAIAVRPRVLVLDDPLSALDVGTEAEVTARLRSTLAGTTTLVVAHRPSTVALADRVAVLDAGRVTVVGRHAELLATHAHYRHVISSLHPGADVTGAGAAESEAIGAETSGQVPR